MRCYFVTTGILFIVVSVIPGYHFPDTRLYHFVPRRRYGDSYCAVNSLAVQHTAMYVYGMHNTLLLWIYVRVARDLWPRTLATCPHTLCLSYAVRWHGMALPTPFTEFLHLSRMKNEQGHGVCAGCRRAERKRLHVNNTHHSRTTTTWRHSTYLSC